MSEQTQPQQPQRDLRVIVTDKAIFDYLKTLLAEMSVKGADALLHGSALAAISTHEDWPSALQGLKGQWEQEKAQAALAAVPEGNPQ